MASFRDFAKENSDGWSLVAFKATADAVAEGLRNLDSVTEYTEDVPVRLMADSQDEDGNYIEFTPSPTERVCFLIVPQKGKWCFVYRTLYWCEVADHEWAQATAQSLSESLDCEAIASCGGGHGFATSIYQAGKLESELPSYDRAVVGKAFTSRKLKLPMCFIGGTPTSLYAEQDTLNEIGRVDRFACRVPQA